MRMFCPFIPMNSLLWNLTWPNQTRVTALLQINLVSIIYFHVYINEKNSLIYMYSTYSSYHHLKVKHFSGWKPALLLHFARIYGRIISNCINFHKIHIWHLRLGPTVWSCSKNTLQWNKLASRTEHTDMSNGKFTSTSRVICIIKKKSRSQCLAFANLVDDINFIESWIMLNRLTRKLFVFSFSIENVNLACVRLLHIMDLTSAVTSSH